MCHDPCWSVRHLLCRLAVALRAWAHHRADGAVVAVIIVGAIRVWCHVGVAAAMIGVIIGVIVVSRLSRRVYGVAK